MGPNSFSPIQSPKRGTQLWKQLIWLLPVVVLAVVLQCPLRRTGATVITYSHFHAELDWENVARVEVTPDEHLLEGSLLRAVTIDGRTASRFRSINPAEWIPGSRPMSG